MAKDFVRRWLLLRRRILIPVLAAGGNDVLWDDEDPMLWDDDDGLNWD